MRPRPAGALMLAIRADQGLIRPPRDFVRAGEAVRVVLVFVVGWTVVCAAVLAGCTTTAARATPTLALVGEGSSPTVVAVRLTNNDEAPTFASYMGFKIAD